MRTENLLAFLRIWTMSMVGAFGMDSMEGVGAALGEAGTRGTVLNPAGGDAEGDCCRVGVVGDDGGA